MPQTFLRMFTVQWIPKQIRWQYVLNTDIYGGWDRNFTFHQRPSFSIVPCSMRNEAIRYWHVCLCVHMHIYFTLSPAHTRTLTSTLDEQETITNTHTHRLAYTCVYAWFICVYVCSSVQIFCPAYFSPCIKLPVKCIANESKAWFNELIQCCAWNAFWMFIKKKRRNSVLSSGKLNDKQ